LARNIKKDRKKKEENKMREIISGLIVLTRKVFGEFWFGF
jgi:hypothetical protein